MSPPLSTVSRLSDDPIIRLAALEDLGYELYDFGLFDGWMILEESSAETLIRAYLIPWFVPRLARVRTIAAQGTSDVEPRFRDLQRLMVFAHLEPVYKNRAIVIVDDDDAGRSTVARLRGTFSDWASECFRSFPAEDFELFYPEPFRSDGVTALQVADPQVRRRNKRVVLEQVISWIEEDRDRAREALEESAGPVIEVLRSVDAWIFDRVRRGGDGEDTITTTR